MTTYAAVSTVSLAMRDPPQTCIEPCFNDTTYGDRPSIACYKDMKCIQVRKDLREKPMVTQRPKSDADDIQISVAKGSILTSVPPMILVSFDNEEPDEISPPSVNKLADAIGSIHTRSIEVRAVEFIMMLLAVGYRIMIYDYERPQMKECDGDEPG